MGRGGAARGGKPVPRLSRGGRLRSRRPQPGTDRRPRARPRRDAPLACRPVPSERLPAIRRRRHGARVLHGPGRHGPADLPLLQAVSRRAESGEYRPRQHGDRARAARPVPGPHLRRVPGPHPVAAEAVRVPQLEGTAQARPRRPAAARDRQAGKKGLRRSLRRLVPRSARPAAARDPGARQDASGRPLRPEGRVTPRRRARRRRAGPRQRALVTRRLRALAARVPRRRCRTLAGDRGGMSRPGALAHWMLRAAVSAAVLAYISHDVDHADLRAALSAVHVRDLVLPLGLYLAGQVLSAVKWWLLGSSVGLARPLMDYVRFYFIGMVMNVFGLST